MPFLRELQRGLRDPQLVLGGGGAGSGGYAVGGAALGDATHPRTQSELIAPV